MTFNTDGTKMFVLGADFDRVYEYACTTGFDVSTCGFTDSFSVTGQDGNPEALAFNTDGKKMFVLGSAGDNVYEYACTTGFDVSTCGFTDSFSVSGQDTAPRGLAFNTDGTKMFLAGRNAQAIHEYTLNVGFDIVVTSTTTTKTLSENLGMTDTTALDGVKFQLIEYLGMTDAVNAHVTKQTLTENLGLPDDTVNIDGITMQTLTENLGMTDSIFAAGNTGTVTQSTTLPAGVSGTISSKIVTVSNPTTSGNSISFLGNTYDYTFSSPTLCSGGCTISFTFTQADLDAAGFSINEATIFEDAEEDGTFVALVTTITDGEPSPFTVQATTTSSGTIFGVGASLSTPSTPVKSGSGKVFNTPPFSASSSSTQNENQISSNEKSEQSTNTVEQTFGGILAVDPEPGFSQTLQKWGGYSSESARDSELLFLVGINGDHIPSWVKKLVRWVNQGDITEQELLNVINYLHMSGQLTNTVEQKFGGILVDPEPGVHNTLQKWGGYSSESATDSELLHQVGLKGEHIPSWVKKLVRWVNQGDITEQELLNVINYLHKTDIIF